MKQTDQREVTLQALENAHDSARRGQIIGGWKRASRYRIDKSPPPPLRVNANLKAQEANDD